MRHIEVHRINRIGWLRAAVLGANDGIVSTASLIVGVAAANATGQDVLLAGIAGLVAGAMSMAAGEYVSVSSQADVENADLTRERLELQTRPDVELAELATVYVNRGLSADLAEQVALQLTAHDALGAHAKDELGISEISTARPIQAALASAGAFALGAAMPLLSVVMASRSFLIPTVILSSTILLASLGALGAVAGGAPMIRAAARVTFWGVFAMGLTSVVGSLSGRLL